MAKFFGKIGFAQTVESEPGYWEESIVERDYYGDINRNTSRYTVDNKVNDDININNLISIVADPYANENFQHMRYAILNGHKWKITNVEIQYPRLLLNLGGLYNGYDRGSESQEN